ncbi:AGR033Wp [Eremothecium gossypii ATCC 10895]|uniref:AGR033Wp n=1 Tax=Eremothecium gossypii (strain ATCC 10895 / CBS 109.51 / FGSC 9923 / NRRL Y-1056) TaxID=284811 RepID=Q750C4_EREGS|nr:AGR033Wp [Eremothecium gossypii ATCC 10895]AAS54522.1 AGR033Wp [Eremothecium gossypii ATCC 10895]
MIEDIKLSVAWATFLSVFQKVARFFRQYHTERLRYNYALDPPQMVYSLVPPHGSRHAPDVHYRAARNSNFMLEALQLFVLSVLVGTMMTLARCMHRAGSVLHRKGFDLPLAALQPRAIGPKPPQRSTSRRAAARPDSAPCSTPQNTAASIADPAPAACERAGPAPASARAPAGCARAPASPNEGLFLSYVDDVDDELSGVENSFAEYYGVSQFAESDIFDLGNLSVRLNSIRSLGINNSPTSKAVKASGMLIW